MAFQVPEKNETLYDDVQRRFRILLKRGVVTGVDEGTLDCWLANFRNDIERYFAACVLGRLTFRSKSMIESSIDHLLQCVLPTDLRRQGLFPHSDIESFLASVQQNDSKHAIRFVGVDGSKASDTGKSGVVIIRHFKRHAGVHKSITCRPDALDQLPDTVRCLVFIDDMLGTGQQFKDFAEEHALAEKQGVHMVYCPLVAFQKGVSTLREKCPWLTVLPIEVLSERHQFFCESEKTPGIWAVDETNTVADAKAFFNALATKHSIPKSNRHGLELLLGFEDATPNNTLSVLWAHSESWAKLLKR